MSMLVSSKARAYNVLQMTQNHPLPSNDALTQLVRKNGITSWNEVVEFVKKLPYGRTTNRADFGLVLSEKKGSCSSKHAFLKCMADLNTIPNVKLILCIFRMNSINTPKIGNVLSKNALEFIPEAHCYLKINGKRIDITTKNSEFKNIEQDIFQELEIDPEQLSSFKVEYHQKFIENWLKTTHSKLNFDQIWHIREQCIKKLSS